MDIQQIVSSSRKNSSFFHLQIGQSWRIIGETKKLHSPLIYSALEYRLAIERMVFEFYLLMVKEELLEDFSLPDSELKRVDSFSKIIKLVFERTENKKKLRFALIFNQIFAKVFARGEAKLSVPDIGKLHNYWQRLSLYCHKQLEPKDTWESEEWVSLGYKIMNEVESYLWDISITENIGWLEVNSLAPELKELREYFFNEEIDSNQVEIRMNIMKPVLDYKKNIKNMLNRGFVGFDII